jgi:hypothetical protein
MFTGPKGPRCGETTSVDRCVGQDACAEEQYGLLPAVPPERLDDRTDQNLDDSAYRSLSGPQPTIWVVHKLRTGVAQFGSSFRSLRLMPPATCPASAPNALPPAPPASSAPARLIA